jgi:hypothetical protein
MRWPLGPLPREISHAAESETRLTVLLYYQTSQYVPQTSLAHFTSVHEGYGLYINPKILSAQIIISVT